MNLYDYIQSKPILNRLYNVLELGLHTNELKTLLPFLSNYDLNSSMLNADHITDLRKQIFNDLEVQGYSLRDLLELCNIVAIYGITAVDLQNETLPEREVDRNWAARFCDYARNYSELDLQQLWSKILFKEMIQPGAFFKRTLEVLYQAEKFEIDWFYESCQFIVDKAYIPNFVIQENTYPFNKLQTLIDCGLVNASLAGITFNKAEGSDNVITINTMSESFNIDINNKNLSIRVYTLTDSGSQLCDLKQVKSPASYIEKLKSSYV